MDLRYLTIHDAFTKRKPLRGMDLRYLTIHDAATNMMLLLNANRYAVINKHDIAKMLSVGHSV